MLLFFGQNYNIFLKNKIIFCFSKKE